MTRRLLASYVLLAAVILVLVELPLGLTYASRAQDRFLSDVERDARVLATVIEEQTESGDPAAAQDTAERYAEQTHGRVVVTDAAGRSTIDTSTIDTSGATTGRDFSTRPEFEAALAGSEASGLRLSDTLGEELAYVAVPIFTDDGIAGALRISFPTDDLREQVRDNWFRLAGLSVLVLATAASIGWFVARWATAPVDELETGARRLADGDLDARALVDQGPPELRQLAATFNEMAARIAALVSSQRAFVADASHQLRTPLTALRLRVEALEDHTHGDPAAADDIEAITIELQRLGELVDALLALARAETGSVTADVDAAATARRAVDRWEPLATEHGVRLAVLAPDRAPARFVDGGLDQVLDNLIDNAIGASPAGTTIEVTVETDERGVRLVVRDHGPGMTAAARARATDRFWRGADAAPGGTGLGLAICADLTRMSGGALVLDAPESGSGLVARVELPSSG